MSRYPWRTPPLNRGQRRGRENENRGRSCGERREGDECTCWCGLRWDATDERPKCPRATQGSK